MAGRRQVSCDDAPHKLSSRTSNTDMRSLQTMQFQFRNNQPLRRHQVAQRICRIGRDVTGICIDVEHNDLGTNGKEHETCGSQVNSSGFCF